MKWPFSAILLALVCSTGCASPEASEPQTTSKRGAKNADNQTSDGRLDLSQLTSQTLTVYAQLHRIPDWVGGGWWEKNRDYTVDGTVVLSVADELKKLPVADLKAAFSEISKNSGYDLSETSRIFLVLRAIYKISYVEKDKAKSYGSWLRPKQEKDGMYNLGWPLSWKPDGTLRIEHSMGYCGAPYNPIGEMEYFIELTEKN